MVLGFLLCVCSPPCMHWTEIKALEKTPQVFAWLHWKRGIYESWRQKMNLWRVSSLSKYKIESIDFHTPNPKPFFRLKSITDKLTKLTNLSLKLFHFSTLFFGRFGENCIDFKVTDVKFFNNDNSLETIRHTFLDLPPSYTGKVHRSIFLVFWLKQFLVKSD